MYLGDDSVSGNWGMDQRTGSCHIRYAVERCRTGDFLRHLHCSTYHAGSNSRTFLHSIKTVNKLTTLASHRKGCEFAVSFVNFGKMLIDTIQTIIC